MKRLLSFFSLVAIFTTFLVVPFTRLATAEETKLVGVITRIEIAGEDAKAATVTLKDDKSGVEVVIVVNDELTLDKFKDHLIVEGDEVRCKYEPIDGKNISRYFRKTAGC